ncbi:hypothetical protein CcrMagneto_gp282 [Caulobacter virus Magneto]|uniref:hypothetical protein n=1 Tax=Caulobacter virus Magneto TaxID=1211642 RepID=UPI00028AE418|nr:hypothetical protein CcrMagneto_gp282 [Caulobacter virus Magneto]AFU87452.1 hypothetical protein CcrMagneto_gp282 [Caulobacter virus Magneto]
MDFHVFKTAVAKQWAAMTKGDATLFRVDVDKDLLWSTYLKAFPAGTDPIFRERSEHDCSCCRNFIRNAGDAVAVVNGQIVTIWDWPIEGEPAYQQVSQTLAALVRSRPVRDIFLHDQKTIGTDKNVETMLGGDVTWNHFFVNVPSRFVKKGKDIPTALHIPRTAQETLLRAVTEITDEAIDTVLDLIAQNALYRGAEHKSAVVAFQKAKKTFEGLSAADKALKAWVNVASGEIWGSVSGIRSTVIGSLLVDLSADVDLEDAVKKFEAKVAPHNYKRTTALVTKKQIENAKKTISDLGLTSALERRYAVLKDVSINDVLFADRDAKSVMNDVFDDLAADVAEKTKSYDKVEEVSIDKFLSDILPRVSSVEALVENRLTSNFVSLIAPVDPTAGSLFKWGNNFSWSYAGEVADSIKARVKAAGGNVTGDLCCRLAWFNYDDLDFHMKEPGGNLIYFRQKSSPYTGGRLDVDMNAGGGHTREPVENIFYGDRRTMKEGVYELMVHQFSKRESSNVGFEVEIDYLGSITRYAYTTALRPDQVVKVAQFKYSHARGIEFISSLPASSASKDVWGVKTETFRRVNVIMLSPNHWEGEPGVGNKHWFFMLDGGVNEDGARGFYNEFLKDSLTPHRRVFEMLGSKLKPAPAAEQLSGLGFSSTKRDELVVRVKGAFTRTLKIKF